MLKRTSLVGSVGSRGTIAESLVLALFSTGSGFGSVDGVTWPRLVADIQGLFQGGMIGKYSGLMT